MYFTEKQLRIIGFIAEFREERSISPTLEEIAKRFSITKATIYEHINQLERKGALKREKFRSRSIELVNPPPSCSRPMLPVAGILRQGMAIEALDEPGLFDPRSAVPLGKQYQALRVAGDSLAGEHILDGDVVIIERRDVLDGEPVIAVLDDRSAMVGRLFRDKDRRLRLTSTNGGDWRIFPKTVDVRGVVVAVLRRFETLAPLDMASVEAALAPVVA